MSIFYLDVEGDAVYAMNATTNITRSSDGELSNSLVQDGFYSSDNYVVRPVVLSFSGIITDISTFKDSKFDIKPKEYLDGLKRAQVNKTPITVHYSDIQEPDSECYFTSFSHTQDSTNGRAGVGLNSFKVKFTLQKVRRAAGATSVAAPDINVAGSVTNKTEKSSATKEVTEKQGNTWLEESVVLDAKAKAALD